MQGLDALKAAVPGFVRRKGSSGGRISALEEAYEEYRLTINTQACVADCVLISRQVDVIRSNS